MEENINLTNALKKYFGFDTFKGNQEAIIRNLLAGNDTFVLMPTGGGKSLCYQLPSLIMEGTAIVISPLIALMKNQVDAMRNFSEEDGVAHFINSSLNKSAIDQVKSDILSGKTKLLYVAPESLTKEENVEFLRGVKISFYAVDEAHCISEWGHDFRPEYRRIRPIINEIGKAPVIALTATATPKVRMDIQKNLGMLDAAEFKSSFNRPNLYYEVRPKTNNIDRDIIKFIKANSGKSGIIYCLSRKKVEELAEILQANGINARAYHAGMDSATRTANQDGFLKEDIDVIVATIAFGMGIDRADVRFVAHFEIPGSVEAYYQEAGRAGRDGEEAYCELLFNHADLRTQEFFIEGVNPGIPLIVELYELLRKHCSAETHDVMWSLEEMAERLKCRNAMQVGAALSVLIRNGVISRHDVPGQRVKLTRVTDPSVSGLKIPLDEDALREKEVRDREKLKAMTEFAYSSGCRQQWILNYFGEEDGVPCGRCDQCLALGVEEGQSLGEEETLVVRQALSGIARASVRLADGSWQGRWGRTKIIQMLKGAKTQELLRTSLVRLSTYGILSRWSEDDIRQLFRAMQMAGLTRMSGEADRPLITLSPKGNEVMMGRKKASLVWPFARRGKISVSMEQARVRSTGNLAALGEFDEDLFLKLKELRNELAREAGIPAYAVFHNSTLEGLARLKPTTRRGAMNVHGIGEQKAARYLDDFLEVIAEHCGV